MKRVYTHPEGCLLPAGWWAGDGGAGFVPYNRYSYVIICKCLFSIYH